MPSRNAVNVASWLKADIQPPENDVCFTPKSGHSEAHPGLPLLTHSGSRGRVSIVTDTVGVTGLISRFLLLSSVAIFIAALPARADFPYSNPVKLRKSWGASATTLLGGYFMPKMLL
jgi:hypothetical protein